MFDESDEPAEEEKKKPAKVVKAKAETNDSLPNFDKIIHRKSTKESEKDNERPKSTEKCEKVGGQSG